MTHAPRTALAAALGASCVLLSTGPAEAAPVPALSGLLTVSLGVPLATLSTTGSTSTGSLGTTTVVDGRLTSSGYDISVTSSGFDLVGPPVTASATTHIPGSAATVRVTGVTGGTVASTAATALPASPLTRLSYPSSVLSLDLVSTYTLSMTVTVPAAAAPGRYTGTVTQTVV